MLTNSSNRSPLKRSSECCLAARRISGKKVGRRGNFAATRAAAAVTWSQVFVSAVFPWCNVCNMLLPLAAMGTLSYHTLITALQIKSSIHHIFIYYCIGSIHKQHENLKRQSWFFIQFHSWPHFYGTPPCSVRFFACYSSSITTNIRSNCWSNLLLLHLVISVETINLKIVRHFLFFWMDAVFHNNVDPCSGDNNLFRTKHR